MAIGDQNYQDERVGIPLTSLTLSHFFCLSPAKTWKDKYW